MQPIHSTYQELQPQRQRKRRRQDGGLQATKSLQPSCYRAAGSGVQIEYASC